jgi:hypothetical protein
MGRNRRFDEIYPNLLDKQKKLKIADARYLLDFLYPQSEFEKEFFQQGIVRESLYKHSIEANKLFEKERNEYVEKNSKEYIEENPDQVTRWILMKVTNDFLANNDATKTAAGILDCTFARAEAVLFAVRQKTMTPYMNFNENKIFAPLEEKILEGALELTVDEALLLVQAARLATAEYGTHDTIENTFKANSDEVWIYNEIKGDNEPVKTDKRRIKRYIKANVKRIENDPQESARYLLLAEVKNCLINEDARNNFIDITGISHYDDDVSAFLRKIEFIAEFGNIVSSETPILATHYSADNKDAANRTGISKTDGVENRFRNLQPPTL